MHPRRTFRAALALGLLAVGVFAEDWPTYRHDAARSGVSTEQLALPLEKLWTFVPAQPPQPAWPGPKRTAIEGILEQHRVCFDDAFQVAVSGGAVYFGSSADNKVYALDAASGAVRWTAFTGAPVRLAPTVWKDRVFAGSDDGCAYCLGAENGRLLWKFNAAPGAERLLGHGRMMSLWPVRTGVLVEEGVAYFGAGLFPAEGVALFAVNAEDGTLLWRNDSFGRTAGGGWQSFSPQGCLLASAERLYAPCGRAMPMVFDRKDGRFLYQSSVAGYSNRMTGGADVLLAGGHFYCGADVTVGFDQKTGKSLFAWLQGHLLVAAPDTLYLVTAAGIQALDGAAYPAASCRHLAARGKLEGVREEAAESLNRKKSALTKDVKDHQEELSFLAARMEGAEKDGKEWQALQARSDALSKALAKKTVELAAAGRELEDAKARAQVLADEEKKARNAVEACIKWRVPCDRKSSLILAGGVLFAGGKDTVLALDAATGHQLWTGAADGEARGLAVSNGRLFVSTDKGAIHCFGAGGVAVGSVKPPLDTAPYPVDELSPVYAAAAERIVQAAGIRKGYCLVLGCGTGRLAYELAMKRTELLIYGIEPDEQKAEAARRKLDAAGLYGVRVTVDSGPLAHLPYPDYFANLIVSDTTLLSGKLETAPEELFRTLRPCGGVAFIGQPVELAKAGSVLSPAQLREWLGRAGGGSVEVREEAGVWGRITRGPLPGAGRWTQQFGDPGNTACSSDQLLKCPLDLLWFGGPGPDKVVNRHSGGAAPLALNGRFILQGTDLVMAYDAYNGTFLWERPIPGAVRTGMGRECGNLAAVDDGVWVAAKDQCCRLDWETGEPRAAWNLPPAPDGKARRWGYVSCTGQTLFGSRTEKGLVADAVFAVEAQSGKLLWVHEGKRIAQASIAIGGERIFFAESQVAPEQREEALKEKSARLKELQGAAAFALAKELKAADVRLIVALDTQTGRKVWEKPLDLTDCGATLLSTLYQDGLVVLCGAFGDGHLWSEFFAGVMAPRRITVLAASDGALVWSKPLGYRTRPVIIADTIYADPWAFELRTGERKMRVHPVTGDPAPFEFGRGHHCGFAAGARNMLFMRSLTSAYYDLALDSGVFHFGGHRPGCAVNMIAADGLLIEPEASSGCVCPHAVQSTVVFKPGQVDRAWGTFCSQAPVTPVKHLAVSLGAPGDRRDGQGTLWLAYPRPVLPLSLKLNLGANLVPGGGYFNHEPERLQVEGTAAPWRFASGCCGLTKCAIPLLGPDDGAAGYTVRLGFVPADTGPGQRVFDIKLMGQVVCRKFDAATAAGGNKTVVQEFLDVPVSRDLTLELVPAVKNPSKEQAPLLNWIEIVRTRVLHAGLGVPAFLLSDARPEQTGEVCISNRGDSELAGTLRLTAPRGFSLSTAPGAAEMQLAPGEKKAVVLQAAVVEKGAPGDFQASVELVGKDGVVDAAKRARIQYLGRFQRAILKAAENAHVVQARPQARFADNTQLWVYGGDVKKGDAQHTVAYLKFELDVPGNPVSAVLRLHVLPTEGAGSMDAGRVCLVEQSWSEKEITYDTRPKPGKELGRLGRVALNEVVEQPLKVALEGRHELSIALDPTNTDGAGFYSRKGLFPPELVVLYEPR